MDISLLYHCFLLSLAIGKLLAIYALQRQKKKQDEITGFDDEDDKNKDKTAVVLPKMDDNSDFAIIQLYRPAPDAEFICNILPDEPDALQAVLLDWNTIIDVN